jgi:hypothetical protein
LAITGFTWKARIAARIVAAAAGVWSVPSASRSRRRARA